MGRVVRMAGWAWPLGLLLAAAAGGEPTPAALPDASFEAAESAWALTLNDGAAGTALPSDQARNGTRGLRLQKDNGRGFLLLATRQPVPIQGGRPVESAVWVQVERREYDGLVYFVNVDVDAEGKDIMPPHYSPYWAWRPAAVPGRWQRLGCRWTPHPNAVATTLRLVVAGNPTTLVLDDAEVTVDPAEQTFVPTVTENNEPPYDEARARANLARRQPEPGRVELVAGRPMVAVGDGFRSALIHQGSFWSPQTSRYAGFAKAGLHLQTVSCQLGPYTELEHTVWKYQGPGTESRFEFTKLERDLLQAIGADPEVRVILLVRCDPPRQWTLDHPDDVWTAEDGGKWINVDGMHPGRKGTIESLGPKETLTPSYGSPAYEQATVAALTEIGRWLATHEVGKLVSGFFIGGCNDGQFFTASVGNQLDHSPGNQQGFRAWLRELYGGDPAALRRAWADQAVTFETAAIAPEAARNADSVFHADQGLGRRVADSQRYDSVAPTRLVKRFAAALERALGRPTFSITYYADAIHDQGSNRYGLSELISGDDRIDVVATVQEYGDWRQLGGSGGVNGVWGSHRLRGVVPLCELDYRTYRAAMAGEWGEGQLGATTTAEGFRAQVRRDIGAAASRGMGAWFYDMGGVWYDHPPLWATIAEAERVMAWAHRPDAPPSTAELAVFVDEDAGWRISADRYHLLNNAGNAQRRALNLSGIPYDLYLLDDIRHRDLPDYRAYLFLTSFTLTRPQVEAIRARCLRPGKVVVMPGAPGLGSPDFDGSVALMQALAGVRTELLPPGTRLAVEPMPDAPLAAGQPGTYPVAGAPTDPVLVPLAPGFTPFARMVDGGRMTHGAARLPGGATLVLFPGSLTPQLVHNAARLAGVGTYGTPGQAIYIGSGVAACHRVREGEARVTFGQPVDLLATDGETVLARAVTTWAPKAAVLETDLVLYRPAR